MNNGKGCGTCRHHEGNGECGMHPWKCDGSTRWEAMAVQQKPLSVEQIEAELDSCLGQDYGDTWSRVMAKAVAKAIHEALPPATVPAVPPVPIWENPELYALCMKHGSILSRHEKITQLAILDLYDEMLCLFKRSERMGGKA